MIGNKKVKGSAQVMFIIAWVIFFVLMTYLFNQWSSHQQNPNQKVQSQIMAGGQRVVVLEQNREGHYVATGSINEVPVTFFVDTGASTISVPQHLAKKLGLVAGVPISVSTANGVITVYLTRISHLKIGDIELADIRASINPSDSTDVVLFGMTALRKLDFSQEKNQLILKQNPLR